MTDDNSNLVDMDDLDKFEDVFFNRVTEEEKVEEKPEDEEVDENEDDTLESDEDTDAEDDESEDEDLEDEDEDDEDEESDPQPKAKGKKSFRNRIDELTAEKYELRRQMEALRAEVEKARSHEEVKKEAPSPIRALPADAPSPDAVDEQGEPLYPLGEFDPLFIRDLTRFSVEQEFKTAQEKAAQEAAARAEQQRLAELSTSWNEKLDKAEEEIPDLRDDIRDLVEVFEAIEPSYGEYLATTLMSMDNGPHIMHYLSQNIGEAQKIVASGPTAATLAIGRLSARLERTAAKEEKRNTKKVSSAAEPPKHQARGQGGKFAVSGDTDDLDAFEREFFKKPARPF